ncbi:uncharacterized protein LOC132065770 [Lycium ferocissimum]|uniref:uncharacterized protein LOC132065770 n=1 Tax=Lycium ferocissimum TaxID=112874 RepID=UPI002814CD64|nr:uncharacterized protein LOC132065770 [Lycium ferocissimum]
MEDQVHQFVIGLSPHLIHDCMTASLQKDMDISRIQVYAQGLEERKQQQRADRERDSQSILSISSHEVYALIDPGSTLSSVTPFIADSTSLWAICPACLPYPFQQGLPWSPRTTVANLIELDVVDFDVIIGIDWLASYYANVDCRTKIVWFQSPGESVLKWKRNTNAFAER